ncbi:MAG: bactofilin family protein [Alcanivorax sp.]
MFHRVKSEVREPEQKSQEQSEKTFRREREETQSRPTSRPTEDRKPAESEEKPVRKYGYSQTKTQEEKTTMRAKEEENVQGKYARESSDQDTDNARSGYTPSVSRSGYAGGSSYGASSYTPPQAPEPQGASDRTLTIGRGINMSGEIDSCDHLLVEGTVEAALKGSKVLDVAESGTFYGTVEIEEATIAGRFEGDLTVNGRLTLKSSGVITGSIAYRELEVEAGAMIDGRMTPMKGTVDQKSVDKYRSGSEASAMAKTKEAKKSDREAANAESGLFSKAHASY